MPRQKGGSHLESGRLVEVGGADALPDDVPLSPARHQWEILLVHDVLQLLTDLPHLTGWRAEQVQQLESRTLSNSWELAKPCPNSSSNYNYNFRF